MVLRQRLVAGRCLEGQAEAEEVALRNAQLEELGGGLSLMTKGGKLNELVCPLVP